jgi:hypothetical protein
LFLFDLFSSALPVKRFPAAIRHRDNPDRIVPDDVGDVIRKPLEVESPGGSASDSPAQRVFKDALDGSVIFRFEALVQFFPADREVLMAGLEQFPPRFGMIDDPQEDRC